MTDDWRSETQLRLAESSIYKALKLKCDTDSPAGIHVMSLTDEAVFYAYQRTKTILRHMGEFTLHDGDHLFRVLLLMEKLLTEKNIQKLSIPELMLLILSAFFHDIGMAPNESEVIAWKKVWDDSPAFSSEREEEAYNTFNRFYSARPEQQEIIENLISQGKNSTADTIKAYLITEFIRQTHADRARDIINQDWDGKFVYRDTDLTSEFAQICYSHNENSLTLLELDKNYLCGPNTFACLPLIGVILRLADILDFDAKRTPSMLYSHLYVREPISIQEWNKHRSVDAWIINSDIIQFSIKCKHPAIEASVHEFCDMIDRELSLCNNIAYVLNEFHISKSRDLQIKIPFKVNRDKIETKRDTYNRPLYLYRETKFNLSKRQVIDLLMGTKLYGDPEIALRELLQNSIDACMLRQAQETKWGSPYTPEIFVKYYSHEDDDILEVIDNGTGMDQYIIDNYYSKVGSSFYKSADFYTLRAKSNANFTPRSRFGIGILSCFMVADTLIVETRRVYGPHESSPPLNIRVEGQDSIFWIKAGQREKPGTTTKLILRKSKNPWEKMSDTAFIKSVENVIPNPPFKINITTTLQETTRDENSFKDITAISMKDHSWKENENMRVFDIKLDKSELGIIGFASVAIIESQGSPLENVNIKSKEIDIEGKSYSLTKKISLEENKIILESTSITINDIGEIKEDTSLQHLASSKSRLSLHGIEVPTSLFPNFWDAKHNQVKVSWPFPLIIVTDICGTRDLDLNTSRTQIIMSEKWLLFEEELAYLICDQIANEVRSEYWHSLKKILEKKTKNQQFLRGLNRVSKF
ncbi:MAG TPA: ATP-binding protein [Phnomibacter sp.]|nr:ATP-binding protein [Phnomibacter sp.]